MRLSKRWNEHCRPASRAKDKQAIKSAIHKYGRENFIIEEIAVAQDRAELDRLEIQYIKQYDTYKNGYNCELGGNGRGKVSEATRKKIGLGNAGKVRTQAMRNTTYKIKLELFADPKNHPFYGRKLTDEHREKIQINQKTAKPVYKLDIKGNILNEYRSLSYAARENGLYMESIKRACVGKQKTSGGFLWQFVNGDR